MVPIKENFIPSQHVRYNGITQVTVADGDDGIFSAFLEFAIKQTHNDSTIYENAAQQSNLNSQKILFIQLSCRKNEVASKLKMQRSDLSVMHSSEKTGNFNSHFPTLKEIESEELLTIEDALKFVIQRECRTFELYKKLDKIMLNDSTKALFEYLVNSQYAIMEFLSFQHSSAIAIRC
jgi:hypothetical protein